MKTKKEIIAELKPKNIEFKVDKFEELILQDIAKFDNETQIKLSRNLTTTFNDWVYGKLNAKEQIKVAIKGQTRSGKSLIGLKIVYLATAFYNDKKFNTEVQVCANQKELKQKLQTAEFGDAFLIDENAFANTGMGSYTEIQQLKDINNIIAKKNIHLIYITPEMFLNVGATLGLAYWGKDTKNWLSRFLLYHLRANTPTLMGYVIFDVGILFQDTGCLIYNITGGCPNPNKIKIEQIPKENILYSECIPADYNPEQIINDGSSCPFYNICTSQMCQYEHKKDKWISREMIGAIGEREAERLEVGLKLFKELSEFNMETGSMMLKAKNGRELKLKIKMKLPYITNSKYTGTEVEEIIQLVLSLLNKEFLEDVCGVLGKDFNEVLSELIPNYEELMKNKKDPKLKPNKKVPIKKKKNE